MLSRFVLLSVFAALAVTAAPTHPTAVQGFLDKCGDTPCGGSSQPPVQTTIKPVTTTSLQTQLKPQPTGPTGPPPPGQCKGECQQPKPFEQPLPDGYALFQISPQINQKLCLAVDTMVQNGQTRETSNWLSNDQQVIFEECNEKNAGQLWALPISDDCEAPINLAGSNFCVDSGTVAQGNQGPQNANQFKVYQCYKDQGRPIMSQDFKFSPDGTIRMVHQHRDCDACLDIPTPGGQYNWGTSVQAWDCNAPGSAPNPNQVFRRKRVAGALGKQ